MPQLAVVTDIYQGRVRVTFQPSAHRYTVKVHGHVDKLIQPSVTTVLGAKGKPALVHWAAKRSLAYVTKKLGEYESKLGAPPFSIGTQEVHSFISEAEDNWNEMKEATIGSLVHRFFEAEMKFRAGAGPQPRLPIVYDPVTMPEFTAGMVEEANAAAQAGLRFFSEHQIEPILLERVLFSPTLGVIGTTDVVCKINKKLAILDYKTAKSIFSENRIQLAAYARFYYEEFQEMPLERWIINTKKDGGLEYATYGIDTYQSDLNAFEACLTLFHFNREHDTYQKGSPIHILGDLDLLVARPPT